MREDLGMEARVEYEIDIGMWGDWRAASCDETVFVWLRG